MCRILFLLFIFTIFIIQPLWSMTEKSFVLKIELRDSETGRPMIGHLNLWPVNDEGGVYKPQISNCDFGVDGVVTEKFNDKPNIRMRAYYFVYSKYVYEVGKRTGVISNDYETMHIDFAIPDSATTQYTQVLYAERKHRTIDLDEVAVTASKIMFYHKGDTLVYNADAFVLNEGSSLDALLSKMPGVNLNSNGVITVNGRKVDMLMLNGRNMFNGQNELMLENIAAYTVKDIAVYEKRTRVSELMGLDMGNKDYVMDVRLKREYSVGGAINAEAGYGTQDRYMGKLFGMWFSDFVSMTAYGSANNLSNTKTPGANDNALSDTPHGAKGEETSQRGGITYVAKGFKERWEANGGVDVFHSHNLYNESIFREVYRTGGNEFIRRIFSSTNKSLGFSTKHHYFTKIGRRVIFEVDPEFSYGKSDYEQGDVTNSFAEAEGTTLINRRVNDRISHSRHDGARIKAETNINLSDGNFQPTMLTIGANAAYSRKHGDEGQRYSYTFGDETIKPIYSHLFRDNNPDHTETYKANVACTHFLDYHLIQLPLSYEFIHTRETHNSSAYMLNALSAELPLDYVPTQAERLANFDPSQSFRSDEKVYSHFITFSPYNMLAFRLNQYYNFTIHPDFSLKISDRRYEYTTNNKTQLIKHTFVLPSASLMLHFDPYHKKKWGYFVSGGYSVSDVPLYHFITRPTDGLNHYIGSSDIRNQISWYAGLTAMRSNANKGSHNISIRYSEAYNTLTLSSVFNPETGETYLSPAYNSGNFTGALTYSLFSYLDKRMHWNISSNTSIFISRSENSSRTINADSEGMSHRDILYSCFITENLKLQWKRDNFNIDAVCNGKLSHFHRVEQGFNDSNQWTLNYGLSSTINLPHNWGISTDLTLYTRRGYYDSRLNTTEFVWNARISKSILKGSLIFILDGYDILRQVKNVTSVVDALARTETSYNSIPSYFLLHLQYRFNKQPKRN